MVLADLCNNDPVVVIHKGRHRVATFKRNAACNPPSEWFVIFDQSNGGTMLETNASSVELVDYFCPDKL